MPLRATLAFRSRHPRPVPANGTWAITRRVEVLIWRTCGVRRQTGLQRRKRSAVARLHRCCFTRRLVAMRQSFPRLTIKILFPL